jgi:4-diphosphocytidyl-2-C-methyl-D-erythritol kinase
MQVFRSPAKINLFLRILQKRPDHYHELASLFCAIDLFDTLAFAESKTDQFTTSDPALPLDERNLIIKACKLFRIKSGIAKPVSIHLEKKIPAQAGLGGGSSNAATTLFALNQLFNARYAEEELAGWSSAIGSDVPFFFSTGTAFCTGRGEKVRSLPALPPSVYHICKPDFGLSTPSVYQALDLKNTSGEDPEALLELFLAGKPCYVNDLEAAAFAICPPLKTFKESLFDQYSSVMMSGSGSAFFGVGAKFASPRSAYVCQAAIRFSDAWY